MPNFTLLIIKIKGLRQFNITKVYIFLSLFYDTVFARSNSLLYKIITFRMSLGWKRSSRRQWSSWPHGNFVSCPVILSTNPNHPAPLPFSFPSVLTHGRCTVRSLLSILPAGSQRGSRWARTSRPSWSCSEYCHSVPRWRQSLSLLETLSSRSDQSRFGYNDIEKERLAFSLPADSFPLVWGCPFDPCISTSYLHSILKTQNPGLLCLLRGVSTV